MKKTTLFIMMAVLALVFAGCDITGDVSDRVYEEIMEVSPETSYDYDLFDSEEKYPFECLLVRKEGAASWETLPLGAIKGFTYQRGHHYLLKVRVTQLANPPADGAMERYELIRVLSCQ